MASRDNAMYIIVRLSLARKMMNFANTLKAEISRITRRELRSELQSLRKSSAQYRSDIAALKRRVAEFERMVRQLGKASTREKPGPIAGTKLNLRFRSQGVSAQRKRLGVSAANFGAIIGVSAQTVYNLEQGKTKPGPAQLEALHRVRKLGKRDVAAQLASR